jgi:uncharacterized protein (TIGR02996 family)
VSTREALLRAVIERPEDDAVRLVYADWLEEFGATEADQARAEFIRAQIQAETLDENDPRLAELRERTRQLERQHRKTWLAGLAPEQTYLAIFRRGFIGSWQCPSASAFLCPEASLFDREPVTFVFLRFGPMDVEALSACPRLARLTGLVLMPYDETGDTEVAELLTSPHLTNLRGLQVHHLSPCAGPATAREIASRPQYVGLSSLALSCHPLGDEGAVSLAGSATLRQLSTLKLGGCEIGVAGARALAESPLLQNVTELDLGANLPGAEASGEWVAPLAARLLPNLVHLDLVRTILTDAALVRLAAGDWPELRSLDLSAGYGDTSTLSAVGVVALASGPLASHLEDLYLNDHPISDAGAAALAQGQRFARLRGLGLGDTDIGVAGLRALVESPLARQLVYLHLGGCRFGDPGALLLAAAWLPAQRSLSLSACDIGEDGALALADSVGLPAELTLDLQVNRPVSAKTLERLRARFAEVFHNA